MKKILLLLALIAPDAFSQATWLNFAESVSKFKNKTGVIKRHVLFPDSTAKAHLDNTQLFRRTGSKFIYYHQITTVLDPYSTVFKTVDKFNLDSTQNYFIDSLGISFRYIRMHSDTTINDTLYIYTYTNNDGMSLPSFGMTGMKSIYGYDPAYTILPEYDYLNNTPIASDLVLTKIILTSADAGDKVKKFAVPQVVVMPGKMAACAVKFIPGYTYSAGDTITKNKNYFSFKASETNGVNTWPTYIHNEYNTSSFVSEAEKYNTPDAFVINGKIHELGTFIWGAPMYDFEHHLIYFRVNGPQLVTFNERKKDLPSLTITGTGNNLRIRLNNEKNAVLEVFNISGAKCFEKNYNEPGIQVLDGQRLNLQNGIYIYRYRCNEQLLTGKIFINLQ